MHKDRKRKCEPDGEEYGHDHGHEQHKRELDMIAADYALAAELHRQENSYKRPRRGHRAGSSSATGSGLEWDWKPPDMRIEEAEEAEYGRRIETDPEEQDAHDEQDEDEEEEEEVDEEDEYVIEEEDEYEEEAEEAEAEEEEEASAAEAHSSSSSSSKTAPGISLASNQQLPSIATTWTRYVWAGQGFDIRCLHTAASDANFSNVNV